MPSIPTSPASIAASQGNLVSLSYLKSWLSITDTNSDTLLNSLIISASRKVLNELSRGPILGFRSVIETRDGTGTNNIMLQFWPVLAVTGLVVNGVTYYKQTTPPFGQGFYWDQWNGSDTQHRQRLYCQGVWFDRMNQNVVINYNAGYQTVDAWEILATSSGSSGSGGAGAGSTSGTYTTNRPWISDQGVYDASTGFVFTQVAETPSTGQYNISDGQYTFAEADIGRAIVIQYSYCPEDLSQAIVDAISWHFRNRDRIGLTSKALLGQETIAFSQKKWGEMTASVVEIYSDVAPI
jgi:hypothetical protein